MRAKNQRVLCRVIFSASVLLLLSLATVDAYRHLTKVVDGHTNLEVDNDR